MANKLLCIFCMFCITTTYIQAQPVLTRGPYLQVGTPSSMNIRWRTDLPTQSKVRYGLSPTTLSMQVENTTATTEHEVSLTGLSPQTQYWYSVETENETLQGDADNFFFTLPQAGSRSRLRIGVLGDCGNNSTNQIDVRNQLVNYLNGHYMTAWLLLGDNAYSNGRDAQYQANFFNIYKNNFLKQNPLYPAPGNHDYDVDGPTLAARANVPYHTIFSMPTNGEAGGLPSGNKAFYSFDIGNIHFLSLDSYGEEANASKLYDVNGTQATWVQQDLAANANKEWVVAYWHHAPYSQGSRNSETEADMTAIRENFINILEDNGVDLILCGHSHVYERTKLMKGHYGYMSTFDEAVHNLSASSALYEDANSCPYIKRSSSGNQGTVYVVSGSAGQLGGSSPGYPHPAMHYSDNTHGGSLLLEVEGSRMDVKWIGADGLIRDQFTMMKDVGTMNTQNVQVGQNVILQASFIGSYTWSNTETTASITVNPTTEGTVRYTVQDAFECVTDTFDLVVSSALPVQWGQVKGWYALNDKRNHLFWETRQEEGNQFFTVERSENGRSFYPLAQVKAGRQPNTTQTYSYIDEQLPLPAPDCWYRIRQTDADGTHNFSPVIKITIGKQNKIPEIVLMPNPSVGNQVKIKSPGNYTGLVTIRVLSATGKFITHKRISLSNQSQSFLPVLPPGNYFIQISAADFFINKQLIIN